MGTGCSALFASAGHEFAAAGDTAALAECLRASPQLIQRTASTNGQFQGGTVLHVAAANDRDHTVAWLLQSGSSLLAVDANGDTALHLAVRNRCIRTIVVVSQFLSAEGRQGELDAVVSAVNTRGELFFHDCPAVALEASDTVAALSTALRSAVVAAVPIEPELWTSPYETLTGKKSPSPYHSRSGDGSNSLSPRCRSPGSSYSMLSLSESVNDGSAPPQGGEGTAAQAPNASSSSDPDWEEGETQRRAESRREWRLIRRFCHALWLQAKLPRHSHGEASTVRRIIEEGTCLPQLRWLLTGFGCDRFHTQTVPNTGLPPLLLAIRRNQLPVVRLLLELGSGGNLAVIVDGNGNTALHHAVTTMLSERDDRIFEHLHDAYPTEMRRIAFRTNDAGFRAGEIGDRSPARPHSPTGSDRPSLQSSLSNLNNSTNETTLFDVVAMLPASSMPHGLQAVTFLPPCAVLGGDRLGGLGFGSFRRGDTSPRPRPESGRQEDPSLIQAQGMNRSSSTPLAAGSQPTEEVNGKLPSPAGLAIHEGGEASSSQSDQSPLTQSPRCHTPTPILPQGSIGAASWDPSSSNGGLLPSDSLPSFHSSIVVAPELSDRHRMLLQLTPSSKSLSPSSVLFLTRPLDSQSQHGAEPSQPSPRCPSFSAATRPPSANPSVPGEASLELL